MLEATSCWKKQRVKLRKAVLAFVGMEMPQDVKRQSIQIKVITNFFLRFM